MSRLSDGQFDYKIFDKIGKCWNSYQEPLFGQLWKSLNFRATNNLMFTQFLAKGQDELKSS